MELSGYVLEMLRENQEFALYRGRRHGNPLPVLLLTPADERPTLACLERLDHEYSLAAELDAAWTARPLALTRHDGRPMLVLEDFGGEPLDRNTRAAARINALSPDCHRPCGGTRPSPPTWPHPQGHQAGERACRRHRQRPAHWVRHRLTAAARAPGTSTARSHCRHACLHGARADRPHESLGRRPQRSLFARGHPLRDANRDAAVQGHRSDGVDPLPHRAAAAAAWQAG